MTFLYNMDIKFTAKAVNVSWLWDLNEKNAEEWLYISLFF